ncbi:MAG: hypothetical protein MZV70_11920 [Desulfobacterales bacterium]|nr:hypothetical protein [Desulfobacterales bacterium]
MIAGDGRPSRLNSPLTSSLGRLFDGVAAHRRPARRGSPTRARPRWSSRWRRADDDRVRPTSYAWQDGRAAARILPAPIIRGVVADLRRKAPGRASSARGSTTAWSRMLGDLCEPVARPARLEPGGPERRGVPERPPARPGSSPRSRAAGSRSTATGRCRPTTAALRWGRR